MAGTERERFDDILRAVAIRTKQDTEIDDLGSALNIPSYDIQSAQKRNNQDHSHMGSLELLRDWVKGQTSSTMRQTLIDALKKIPREDILSVCFPEVVADSSGQHGAEGPIHSLTFPHEGPSHPSTSHVPMRRPPPRTAARLTARTRIPTRRTPSHTTGLPTDRIVDRWQNRNVRAANPSPNELDHEMQYVMWESLVKGNALVIGNADFPQPGQHRRWADTDIKNMKRLLEKLGYKFRNDQHIHKNLSKPGMEEAVQLFTEQLEKDIPQSAVVYISSHGDETGIQGSDGSILPITFLLENLSGVLLGKPKVLIVDACWGGAETRRLQGSVSNSSSGAQIETAFPENADIFMIHSTSYGKTAWSETDDGSWFVNHLCEVVYNNDRDLEDLDTIMLRVTKGLRTMTARIDGTDHGTQSTTVLKQGVDRKLFFYPGFQI